MTRAEIAHELSTDDFRVTPRMVRDHIKRGGIKAELAKAGRPRRSKFTRLLGASINELRMLSGLSSSLLFKHLQSIQLDVLPKIGKTAYFELLWSYKMKEWKAPSVPSSSLDKSKFQEGRLNIHAVCLERPEENRCIVILGAYEMRSTFLHFRIVNAVMSKRRSVSSSFTNRKQLMVRRDGVYMSCAVGEVTLLQFIKDISNLSRVSIDAVLLTNTDAAYAYELQSLNKKIFTSTDFWVADTPSYLQSTDYASFSIKQIAEHLDEIQNAFNSRNGIQRFRPMNCEVVTTFGAFVTAAA